MDYQAFIESKKRRNESKGFAIQPTQLNARLKPFQAFATRIALDKGCFCLFEDCGLGKTFQSLEWSRIVSQMANKPVINLAPLAVTGQTILEGRKFGIEVNELGTGPIQITNYEQLDNIDFSQYAGVVGDEISIIKNFEGTTRNKLIEYTRQVPYKLGCSATPSPNDPMELGNIVEWMGIMSYHELLATYFTHDGGDTAKWRLKGHAIEKFWRFINSFSLMFSKPSDIGFSDAGYNLPKLHFIEREIVTEKRDNGRLFNDTAVSATNFHAEVRVTKVQRISDIIQLVNGTKENFIVWVEQDEEGDYLEKLIPDAVQVSGKTKGKEDKLLGFAANAFRVLITKPKIAAFGLNYQNCHNQAFVSPDFSFEKIYQAIRRSLRFGQLHDVNVYLTVTDTMQSVLDAFRRKEAQHHDMQLHMNKYTKEIYADYYAP